MLSGRPCTAAVREQASRIACSEKCRDGILHGFVSSEREMIGSRNLQILRVPKGAGQTRTAPQDLVVVAANDKYRMLDALRLIDGQGWIAGFSACLQRCPVAPCGLDEVPVSRSVLREILRILGAIGNDGECGKDTTEFVRRQANQAITGCDQRNPVEPSGDALQQMQRYGCSNGISNKIDTIQSQVIKQTSDIGCHVGGAIRACVMGLVALAMTSEVQTNDLKPAAHELLRPSESRIVRLKADRSAVQEDQRTAFSANLKVQTNVSVLEVWQRAPLAKNLRDGILTPFAPIAKRRLLGRSGVRL